MFCSIYSSIVSEVDSGIVQMEWIQMLFYFYVTGSGIKIESTITDIVKSQGIQNKGVIVIQEIRHCSQYSLIDCVVSIHSNVI